jgi:outer membrane protein assembly factor BamA
MFLLLLLWPFPGHSQKQPPRKAAPAQPKTAAAPVAWPVESVEFEGLKNYSREQVLSIARVKVGQTVTPKDLEAAQQRLHAAGIFDSIEFRYGPGGGGKGYAVVFRVVEAGPLFPVRFEELNAPAAELEQALRREDPLFGPKIPATQPVLDRYARAIERFLASRDRGEKVVGKLAPDDQGQLGVVFGPAAAPPAVAFVKFTNNEVVPSTTLQNTMAGVAVGTPYREARFRQLLETSIRPLYEARGRLRVTFPEVRTEPAKDVNGLLVTVSVSEGPSYNLGEIRFGGDELPAEDLKKAADLKPGDLANFDIVNKALERVERRYRREGYMRAAARADRSIDDEKKTVDLTVRVEPGPQFLFGKLSIEGLDLNSEAAVRKLWAMQEGKRFNADYPEYFLEQVREGGFFDNLGKTRAVLDTHDESRIVNVRLVFAGAPPEPPDRFRR